MTDYVIMTDSCCDLPREYIDENKIPYVSLTCQFGEKEYSDDFGKTFSHKEFYDGMRAGIVPKTSQPSSEAFYEVFKEIVSQKKDVIYVCVSSGLSGTVNSANIAKKKIEEENKDAKIAIVDVLTASLGQGLMVIKSMEMQRDGASFEDIVQFLEDYRWKLNTFKTVNDLNHLKRGGRISATSAIIGIVLSIKPVLTLDKQGKVLPVKKVKGRQNVIKKLAEYVSANIEEPEGQTICISHGDTVEDAEKLKELILKEFNVKEVFISHIGPVVGTYGGPGALAVFFMGKVHENRKTDF
ncbi:DegV family protein with EDD domain [Desulfitispora alkaliphila]|uniref:DegV family protein n=1 Tax=Desulfitispora alkaliphila TaxID=622674 RepID=UPI003D2141C8